MLIKHLLLAAVFLVGLGQIANAQTPPVVGPRGPIGPQASITCVAGPGVDIVSPSINIQAAVNTHPANTLFCFLPGLYKNVHVTPRAGNKFIAQKGAILDGQNTTKNAFTSNGNATNNITIQNFIIQNYVGGYQVKAINGENSTGWTILNNEVRQNDGVGVSVGGSSIIQYNYIHHNLEMGYASNPGTGIQVLDNEIAFNNYTNKYDCNDECGGGKLWSTTGAVVSYNYTHDNHGPGLWDDYDNNNITYSFNRIENNWAAGIQHEIGYNASIHDNTFLNNGNSSAKGPSCSWLWCSAIQINASGGVSGGQIEVYNNYIITGSKFGNAVGLVQQNRQGSKGQQPCCGAWLIQNVWVHDNYINLSGGGGIGGITDENNTLLYAASRNIKFDRNHYTLGTNNKSVFWWNNKQGAKAFWQGLGMDVNGTFQ